MEKYRIERQLGDGNFGVVYRAVALNTGEIVAIKKFKSKFDSWDEVLKLKEGNFFDQPFG